MGTELDSVKDVLQRASDLYADVLSLRSRVLPHTEQLLHLPRHMSLVATDIENAILRLHYVEDIIETVPGALGSATYTPE